MEKKKKVEDVSKEAVVKETAKNGLVAVNPLKREMEKLKKELDLSNAKLDNMQEEASKKSILYDEVIKNKDAEKKDLEDINKGLAADVKKLKLNIPLESTDKASCFAGVVKSHGDSIHTFGSDSIGRA